MQVPIKLQVTPSNGSLQAVLAEKLDKKLLTVLAVEGDAVTLGIDVATPPVMALGAVAESLPQCDVRFYPDNVSALQTTELRLNPPIDSVDIVNIKPQATHVWSALFKKPPPVFDRQHWADSDISDKFIYIPNCTRFEGPSAEDYNSNAMYTQIMLEAYQDVCRKRKVNPLVRLASGAEVPVLNLRPFQASQTHISGERASGFANSTLVDFDDGVFAKDFITAVSLLKPEQYTTEPAKQTVLSKAELILAGKASHMYNQRFMKDYFSLMTVNFAEDLEEEFKGNSTQAQTTLLNIFRGMVADGFVLEAGIEEFQARLWQSGMGDYVDFVCKIYQEVTND